MKWLVLLLLILNVVYFGWELDRQARSDVANARAAVPAPGGVKKLVLLSELDSRPPERSGEESAPADPAPEPFENSEGLVLQLPDISVPDVAAESLEYSCFTFGPLPEERHAVWLGDWFRSRRGWVQSRGAEDPDRRLFWVYLTGEGSRESAAAVMEDLEKKGIRDYRLISRGDMENSISLGLFSTQAAVNERLSELKEKGYRPVVVPYTNVQQTFWLDVKIPAAANILEEMFRGFPARYNSVPVKCDQIAISQSAP